MTKIIVCINCHQEFIPRNRRGTMPKFCSGRCRQQNYRKTRNTPEQAGTLKSGITKSVRTKTRNASEQAGTHQKAMTAKNLRLQAMSARLPTVPVRGGVCIVCDGALYVVPASRLTNQPATEIAQASRGQVIYVAPTEAAGWLNENRVYRWTP